MVRKLHLKADAALAEIERTLQFSTVNPENSDSIKRKFLRKPFEPEFVYAEKPDVARIRERLEELKCGRTKPGQLLKKERDQLLVKADWIDAIGSADVHKLSKKLYGSPDKQLVRNAEELLTIEPSSPVKKIRYDEVRRMMRHTFKLLGFSYTIKRTQMVTSAICSPAKRRVELRSKERFSRMYAFRLAVHEIATHALRAENGRTQGLGIFSRGTPDYLATEEGLAAYNEERAGVMTRDILRNYAGRVLAVSAAEKNSFVETYKILREHFSKEDAYKLTMRAKRGLGNGEEHGGCTKDYVYLHGYMGIKRYVADGRDLKHLYAAKIGLEDVKGWSKRLKEPEHIPEPVIEWVRHELVKSYKR